MPFTHRLTHPSILVLGFMVVLAPSLGLAQSPPESDPPNIVFIVADDLSYRLAAELPGIQSLLTEQGTAFTNFFVTTPSCCPSRASFLRGQYAHNHGVLGNKPPSGGYPIFLEGGNEESTVATWLQSAGYRTGLFGKYLNYYPDGASETHVPPGWDDWAGWIKGGKYSNYELIENGTLVSYGNSEDDYETDVYTRKTVDFIHASAAEDRPFFAYVAPHAPHAPAVPPARYAETVGAARAPRVPSFNEAEVSDKPRYVQKNPLLSAEQIAELDNRYRDQWRSMLAVEDMVESIIEALEDIGKLENTYIIFTSDNGLHLGEHRRADGKGSPYEASVNVPFIVRGPGVPEGETNDRLTLNIDVAPTLAELAGAPVPGFVDGRSLAPLLHGTTPSDWRRVVLTEYLGGKNERFDESEVRFGATKTAEELTERKAKRDEHQSTRDQEVEQDDEGDDKSTHSPRWIALRTADILYVEYQTGDRELYDLRTDPWELDNRFAAADSATRGTLTDRLAALLTCAGSACRELENAPIDRLTIATPVTGMRPGND